MTPEAIEACRKLNVKVIFIGIESTDWNILSSIKKPYTIERIEEVLQLIYDAGIHADIPFMYGLPGETSETMERNNRYIQHIVKTRRDLSKVMVNLTVPIYGCDLFDDLAELPIVQKAYRSVGNIDKDDEFDYELLIRLMIAHQTDVSYPEVVKSIKQAQDIIGARNSDLKRYKFATSLVK